MVTFGRRSPQRIVSLFTRRWSIEVTFEEVRAHLGFETTRQRVAKSVLRSAVSAGPVQRCLSRLRHASTSSFCTAREHGVVRQRGNNVLRCHCRRTPTAVGENDFWNIRPGGLYRKTPTLFENPAARRLVTGSVSPENGKSRA